MHHGFSNVGTGTAKVHLIRQNEFFRKVEELFKAPKPDMVELKRLQQEYDQELVTFPGEFFGSIVKPPAVAFPNPPGVL